MSVLRKHNPVTGQWDILQGGVQGLQGPPVALGKGTVTTTGAGTNADFSITGTPPAQVLNLTLPRGEAGGWVAPALLLPTADLNALIVSGLYVIQSGVGVLASTGWPIDGFAGYVEVISRGSSYVLQRATAIKSEFGETNTNANTWYRAKFGTTWGRWLRTPVIGRLDTDIVGAGRPDIPATLTTEVAALVAEATSGAKFRSTDGPQGAWEWQKRGSTWVCVEGDTGWRWASDAHLLNGYTGSPAFDHFRPRIRRTNNLVFVAGGLGDIQTAKLNGGAFLPLPLGFRPSTTGELMFGYLHQLGGASNTHNTQLSISGNELRIPYPTQVHAGLTGGRIDMNPWVTSDQWPALLPYNAA